MDGVRIEDVASSPGGVDGFPDAIEASLKARRDRPRAARRVTIPKADGGERPLGIPSVRDRVVEGGGEAGSGADLRGGLHGVFSRRIVRGARRWTRSERSERAWRRDAPPFMTPI